MQGNQVQRSNILIYSYQAAPEGRQGDALFSLLTSPGQSSFESFENKSERRKLKKKKKQKTKNITVAGQNNCFKVKYHALGYRKIKSFA